MQPQIETYFSLDAEPKVKEDALISLGLSIHSLLESECEFQVEALKQALWGYVTAGRDMTPDAIRKAYKHAKRDRKLAASAGGETVVDAAMNDSYRASLLPGHGNPITNGQSNGDDGFDTVTPGALKRAHDSADAEGDEDAPTKRGKADDDNGEEVGEEEGAEGEEGEDEGEEDMEEGEAGVEEGEDGMEEGEEGMEEGGDETADEEAGAQ